MARIATELLGNGNVQITFTGKQGAHVRLADNWTDWMLQMNDFRDFIIPLSREVVDSIVINILNDANTLQFENTAIGQEYNLGNNKKIVKRVGPGNQRNEYQSIALFIKNDARVWPPAQVEINQNDICKTSLPLKHF